MSISDLFSARSRALRRRRMFASAAMVAIGIGAVGVVATRVEAAVAPVPTFPDNLIVFPDRDFVSIDGYSEYAGKTATIEVNRPGVGIVGSAQGVVSGGDVAFEVNHPGGVCWGAGTGLNVTPDILPHDEVTIFIDGNALGSTTVLDAQAFDSQLQPDGVTLIVNGHIGADVVPDNIEQRIVEAGLVDTVVGKRDVRAIPGPLVSAPRGGYSSGLSFSGDTFTATYVFDDPVAASVAANAGLGERALAWQVVDPAGNRQGLTIAEHGEPGGPGVGGCPNGPRQSGPPAPTNIVAARNPGSSSIKLNWTPAVAIPGTPALDGYRVTAIDTTTVGSERVEIGRRIATAAATGTTITGLDPAHSYDVEVVSVSTAGITFPAATAVVATDSTAPTVSASPGAGSYALPVDVTLSANEPGVDIYYTLDGTDPIDVSGTTPTALHYTGPVHVAASATLTFAGYDPSNNPSSISSTAYVITNLPTAAATTITSATAALQSVDLTWLPAAPVAPATAITGYVVRVFDSASGTTPLTEVQLGNVTSAHIAGLVANTNHWFTVAAKNEINSAYGPESPRVGPVSPLGSVVANAGADRADVARNTSVQLSGAGSTTGAGVTYAWLQVDDPNGFTLPALENKVTITGAASINASFTMPLYKMGMTLGPLYFRLTVTDSTSTSRSDVVRITPRNDTVGIATAKWKAGDFRVTGTGVIEGALITILTPGPNNTFITLGTVQTVAGAWDFRLRNGAAPATRPTAVYAVSNQGARVGPFTVS